MTIYITPVPKPRMTRSDKWKQRDSVVRYRAFGDELRLKLPGYTLPAQVELIFRIPMPASWSQKKRVAIQGSPHQQRPDIDNLVKAIFDHLAPEDSYIYHVEASKFWGYRGSITIEEAQNVLWALAHQTRSR